MTRLAWLVEARRTAGLFTACATTARFMLDDYFKCVENIRQTAEAARQLKLKVTADFVRHSTFLASLPTALRLHREAAHSNFGILFDWYHCWSGPNKFRDMDLIRPGQIIHAHLNDIQDLPRELLDLRSRVIPGDGVARLAKILEKTCGQGLSGTAELFLPKISGG